LRGISLGLELSSFVKDWSLGKRQMRIESFDVNVENLKTQEQVVLIEEIDFRVPNDKVDEVGEIVRHVFTSQEHIPQKFFAEIV